MRRRLLEICLLAYPRVRRERDSDYLRDLALELADAHGLRRQILSLLRGGLGERAEVRRLAHRAGAPAWKKRFVVACSVLAAMLPAIGVVGGDAADGERVEADRFACLVDVPDACVETKELVAKRLRGGWACASRRITRHDQPVTSWRCNL